MKYFAIGIMSLAFIGAALAIAFIFCTGINGIARNPTAEEKISKYIFVGGGLAEAIALFTLVICLLLILQ